ncbi:Uncharacterised protein [uncultured Blautia sp.]|nr:Uncharacterised protein [uncultured Blautia sp.]
MAMMRMVVSFPGKNKRRYGAFCLPTGYHIGAGRARRKKPDIFFKKRLTGALTCVTIILTCEKGFSFHALFSLFSHGGLPAKLQGGNRDSPGPPEREPQ